MGDEVAYPVLFGTTQATWGPIDLRFELLSGEVDPDRIARVFVVPFIGPACVVVGFEHGDWGPAGGGLEPGESFLAALERELAEEAGGSAAELHPVRGAALPFPGCRSLPATRAPPRL
jgi:8-oxo-dGTP pyrophosphatase MutT (NUDIX family)